MWEQRASIQGREAPDEAPCVCLMRCNWLLERRSVEGDDLLDHQPCSIHPPVLCSPWFQLKIKPNNKEGAKKDTRSCDIFGLHCSLMQFKLRRCCFLPAIDLAWRTFHQWGKETKKKGNVEIITVTGTGEGFYFGSLLGLFLPIYSISCYWLVNTNL